MNKLSILALLLLAGCAYIPIPNPSPDFFAEQWRKSLRCNGVEGMLPIPNYLPHVPGDLPRCEDSTANANGCSTIDFAKKGDVIEINPEYSVTVGKEVRSVLWKQRRIVPIVAFREGHVSPHLTMHENQHVIFYYLYNDIDPQHKRDYECK